MKQGAQQTTLVTPRSRLELEVIADSFLESFQPTMHLSLEKLWILKHLDCTVPREFGFHVDVTELRPGIEAETDFGEREIRVTPETYDRAAAGDGRARFTIAHEIGHVLTIDTEIRRRMVFEARMGVAAQTVVARRAARAFEDPEWQADGVGAALLMPRQMVRRLCQDGRANLEAREMFGVSRSALETRLAVLDRLERKLNDPAGHYPARPSKEK